MTPLHTHFVRIGTGFYPWIVVSCAPPLPEGEVAYNPLFHGRMMKVEGEKEGGKEGTRKGKERNKTASQGNKIGIKAEPFESPCLPFSIRGTTLTHT